MKLWLKQHDELKPAIARIAAASDLEALAQWKQVVNEDSPQNAIDSASYAEEALRRWQDYHSKQLAADSFTAARQMKANRPEEEIALLLVLEAAWWELGRPAAFAYVRRTWCGNLYLEYLSKHPTAMAVQDLGFGNALEAMLAFVGCVAGELDCSWVWWETTESSVNKYEKLLQAKNILGVHKVKDLFVVPPDSLKQLASAPK